MPDWLRFPLVLTIVAAISAAALAGLWKVTLPEKQRIQAEITERALKVVMPEASTFEDKSAAGFKYKEALSNGKLVGYVATGDATGYSSILKVMVGVKPDFTINAIKVLSQKETPGLGDQVEAVKSKKTWYTVITGTSPDESKLRPWFQTQFDGLIPPVKVDKDGGRIESITGATISSRAVCNAVDKAVSNLKTAIQ
jgi:electron transport complex protein RnfG